MNSAEAVVARKRSRCGDEGVARICCIFFDPARCVRIDGHLIAAERSRWSRASQDFDEVYSVGA